MDALPRTDVVIPAGAVTLPGTLAMPERPRGVVAFAHGSGSSRFSPRNREVASTLNAHGFATLLFDLLTAGEGAIDERTRALRFDIPLLGERLTAAVDWLASRAATEVLPLGLFGASTGAAAALIAAAARTEAVRAVVSRGGRPDLAGSALDRVEAPVLLIVGGRDEAVIEMNRSAQARLHAPTSLEIVSGATHLFEEPGALEQVSSLAEQWCRRYLMAEMV